MNFRYRDDGGINVALDETTNLDDLEAIATVFADASGNTATVDRSAWRLDVDLPVGLARTSSFLTLV